VILILKDSRIRALARSTIAKCICLPIAWSERWELGIGWASAVRAMETCGAGLDPRAKRSVSIYASQ